MKTQAIVPMAGLGVRFDSDTPKPLILLKDKPIFIYALEALVRCDAIESIILVVHEDYRKEYKKVIDQYAIPKVKEIIRGGKTRRDSVLCGIKRLDQDTDIVLIHDGARPLINEVIIRRSIELCETDDAVIVAVEVKPTIKRVDEDRMMVAGTLKRKGLWEVQTPQVFKKEILIEAHKENQDLECTDDAFLVEKLGRKVRVLQGNYSNIKITTPEDLWIAEILLKDQRDKD